ncbi:MAG: hypothetical protein ACP6IY_11155 [Promethearchaeia archaeon]
MSLRLAINIGGEYIWIKPKNIYDIGKLGDFRLFLYVDENSEIIFYYGKEDNKYRQMFS